MNTYEMKYTGLNMRKQLYNRWYKGITKFSARCISSVKLTYVTMQQRDRLEAKMLAYHTDAIRSECCIKIANMLIHYKKLRG